MAEQSTIRYPSPEHARAAESIVQFFSVELGVAAVLLVGACVRGKATRDTDLDILVLRAPGTTEADQLTLARRWERFQRQDASFRVLEGVGKYTEVDLEFGDGWFAPKPRGWTTGPDDFELQIGNTLVYSVPLLENGEYLQQLKGQWLPYYDEVLRRERLAAVRRYFQNDLDHIPLFIERRLYFQSFDRLYNMFHEFLQALFIARRAYPISYYKWIREQVEEILGLPELYRKLPQLFEVRQFESREIAEKANGLAGLLEEYVVE